jgi:3-hydroxyacyl-CoA dehydrogenase
VTTEVGLQKDGEIAVITVDNPPVNALKQVVRAGLLSTLTQARDDAATRAIVLVGAGRTFIAGADITEFGKPSQPPSLPEIIGLIENSPKPVIAAMHGTPLGGGLELTLACHFRIAAPGTRLGLPEIKLGLIPGAGGTQRLPRLVGMDRAMAMILSGEPVPAQQALADGLIDEIVEGDLTAAAVAFARRVLAEKRPLRRVRDLEGKIEPLRANPEKFAELAAARSPGTDLPVAACRPTIAKSIFR